VVAVQARHHYFGVSVALGRDGLIAIFEGFVVVAQLGVEIGLARADQRVAAKYTGNIRSALGAKGFEFLAQIVFEAAVGNPGGGLAELQLVGGAGVIQAVKAAQHPQGGHIPETCQVVDMNGATQAIFTGVVAAPIVGVDTAGDASARGDIHNQVRRPH